MKTFITYLTFNGNCKEAMTFYHQHLGGELELKTIGESPLSDRLPKDMRSKILHSSIKNGEIILMGTDLVNNHRLIKGNNRAILIDCENIEELEKLYTNLSQKGKTTSPPEKTIWNTYLGGFTDKFGHQWLVHCKHN